MRSTRRRPSLWHNPVLFPAVMSVVASLVGAAVGGLVTAYATQATVRAQVDSAHLQAESDRAIQVRDARGRTYENLLNTAADADALLERFLSCSAAAWDLTSSAAEPVGPDSTITLTRRNLTADVYAACQEAAVAYADARLLVEKARNGLYEWGTREAVTAAEHLATVFPMITCSPAGLRDGRSCQSAATVSWWMYNLVYPPRMGDKPLVDDSLFAQKDPGEVHALGRAVGTDPWIHQTLYRLTVAEFRHWACRDLAGDSAATC